MHACIIIIITTVTVKSLYMNHACILLQWNPSINPNTVGTKPGYCGVLFLGLLKYYYYYYYGSGNTHLILIKGQRSCMALSARITISNKLLKDNN